jgi:hypothetical protein
VWYKRRGTGHRRKLFGRFVILNTVCYLAPCKYLIFLSLTGAYSVFLAVLVTFGSFFMHIPTTRPTQTMVLGMFGVYPHRYPTAFAIASLWSPAVLLMLHYVEGAIQYKLKADQEYKNAFMCGRLLALCETKLIAQMLLLFQHQNDTRDKDAACGCSWSVGTYTNFSSPANRTSIFRGSKLRDGVLPSQFESSHVDAHCLLCFGRLLY